MGTFAPASMKISAAVSGQLNAVNTGTIYTCPADSYAILNAAILLTGTAGVGAFLVAGNAVFKAELISSGSYVNSNANGANGSGASYAQATTQNIYVGPGQAVTVSGTGSQSYNVSGVEFINSAS